MTEIDGYEVLGLGLYFEDLPLGRKFRTIGRTLTEADLVNFIGVTGMTEVLFSNTEFLRTESDITQRVVPGASELERHGGAKAHLRVLWRRRHGPPGQRLRGAGLAQPRRIQAQARRHRHVRRCALEQWFHQGDCLAGLRL